MISDNRFRSFLLRLVSVAVACATLLIVQTATAYGQAGAPAEGGKSYGVPWLVIVLVVALGVFITLRPAGRAAEIKRDPRAEL